MSSSSIGNSSATPGSSSSSRVGDNQAAAVESTSTLTAAESALNHVVRLQGNLSNTRSSLGRVSANLRHIQVTDGVGAAWL